MSIKTIEPDAGTPDGLLLAAAEALHGTPHELTPEAREISRTLLASFLSAAAAAGYRQVGILETLLTRCEIPLTLGAWQSAKKNGVSMPSCVPAGMTAGACSAARSRVRPRAS